MTRRSPVPCYTSAPRRPAQSEGAHQPAQSRSPVVRCVREKQMIRKLNPYAILLTSVIAVVGSQYPGTAEPAPSEGFRATYDVTLAGLSLGEFQVTGQIKTSKYALKAAGEFSLLRGVLYRAKGRTKSEGTLTRNGPVPSSFTVVYEGRDKKETRSLDFDEDGVTEVTIKPRKRQGAKTVPVTEAHLVGVLDPLTAAFLTARPSCDQTLPIFDGKQRFDLVLAPKGTARIDKDALAGVSGSASVCQVKYKPISGFKPDHPGVKFMMENENVELWLVEVPYAELSVPYRVSIPTAFGTGVAQLTAIQQ